MSKHTKGPWVIKGTLFGEWHISSEYSVDGKRLSNGRQHIACSPSASSKLNPEYFAMFMANARLIAAAPDLLEVLDGLLAAYSEPDQRICCSGVDCGCMGATTYQQAEHYARAAIARARGES